MIPSVVENRIARYFFHMYLPEDVLGEVQGKLLPSCISTEDKALDHDELVRWAIEVIDKELESKEFR